MNDLPDASIEACVFNVRGFGKRLPGCGLALDLVVQPLSAAFVFGLGNWFSLV